MKIRKMCFAATVLSATVVCGSERAKIAVLDLGLGAAKGTFGQASDPAVFERALRGGYDIRRIGADELASPAFFSASNCDLLIVPTGSLFPMTAASNLVTFLKNRGQLLTSGGYAFDTPAVQRGGKWVSPKGLAGPLPSGTKPVALKKAVDWTLTASEEAPAPTVLKDVTAPDGSAGVEVSVKCLETYNSAIAALAPSDLASGSVLSLFVKGGEGTPAAAFELDETDGSRWRVMLSLTPDWREVRYSAADFKFMPDRSPKTRGGLGDHIDFAKVCRVNFGLSIACLKKGGPYAAAIAGLKVGVDPEAETRALAKVIPHINTRYAFIRTALFPKPEQVGVFDPSFLLEGVTGVKLAPELEGVFPAVDVPGTHDGFAAVGPLGLDGRGFSANRCAWRPLLSTQTAAGEDWGPAAAVLRHYDDCFKGSSWAFFGLTDTDLFAEGSPVLDKLLVPLVESLVRRTFLHETEANWPAFDRGETARLTTKVSNFSRFPRKGTVRFALTDEAGRTVHVAERAVDLAAGKTVDVACEWTIPESAPDILFMSAELRLDGRLADREQTAFVVRDAKVRAAMPRPKVVGDHIAFDGATPRFTVGTQNFWGQGKSVTGRSPLYYYRDFKKMREYGFGWTRCSCMCGDERELRFFDALTQLANKFGIVMYWTTWGQTEVGEKAAAKKLALTAKGAGRYRDVGGFMVDICNEPQVGLSEVAGDFRKAAEAQSKWADENREAARAANPGVLCSVGWNQGWGGGGRTMDPQLASRTLDFTDRHYYCDYGRFSRELKSVDRRVFGQPLVQGECGAKCHPTNKELDPRGDGDDEEGYCRRFRYLLSHTFGLGASAISVWQWRDPMEGIMAAGLMHQTNVPRPAALVCRDLAKAFGSLPLAPNPPEAVVVLSEERRFRTGRFNALAEEYRLRDALIWWGANFSVVSSSETERLPSSVRLRLSAETFGVTDETSASRAALREAVGKALAAAGVAVTRKPDDPETVETFRVPGVGATGWVIWNGSAAPYAAERGGTKLTVPPERVGYLQIADDGKVTVQGCW